MNRAAFDFDLLHSYTRAAPSDDEVDLVTRVRGFVAAIGVYLPPHEVGWYQATPGLPDGITNGHSWPVEVKLRVGQTPRDLVRTILHELAHVADSRDASMFVGEREERAERFAAAWTDPACHTLGVK